MLVEIPIQSSSSISDRTATKRNVNNQPVEKSRNSSYKCKSVIFYYIRIAITENMWSSLKASGNSDNSRVISSPTTQNMFREYMPSEKLKGVQEKFENIKTHIEAARRTTKRRNIKNSGK